MMKHQINYSCPRLRRWISDDEKIKLANLAEMPSTVSFWVVIYCKFLGPSSIVRFWVVIYCKLLGLSSIVSFWVVIYCHLFPGTTGPN